MTEELYKKYRPKKFEDVIGQPEAVRVLMNYFKGKHVPHTMLFLGPSGCGKTTLARIVSQRLKCSKSDFREINCANFRGIDTVRDIQDVVSLAPMGGQSRVWVIDESHKLTNDAQNAFLKLLEDTPRHAYFMLATTEPNKLIKTILNRSAKIRVNGLVPSDMRILLMKVATEEGLDWKESCPTYNKIIELADGSAREALVLLESVMEIEDENDRVNTLQKFDSQHQAFEIVQCLLYKKSGWEQLAKIIKAVDEEPERIRRLILDCAGKVLLNNNKGLIHRAYLVLQAFRDNFYDSGKAGLITACYEVFTAK